MHLTLAVEMPPCKLQMFSHQFLYKSQLNIKLNHFPNKIHYQSPFITVWLLLRTFWFFSTFAISSKDDDTYIKL